MSQLPDWLPAPLSYNDFRGDYEKFLAAVYEIFKCDFKRSRPKYKGSALTYDARIEDGKEAVFWHVTTSTDIESNKRVPDLRRSERIAWLRAIIEHPDDEPLKLWTEKRRRGNRIHIWLEEFDYLVVLGERPRAMILITAVYTDSEHTRRSLNKRWSQSSGKANDAP